jgi:hypothetical protein
MQIKTLKYIPFGDFFVLDFFLAICHTPCMRKPKLHLHLRVHGEDVIIDYKNEDVIFPNRPEEADKLRFNKIAAISSYLKEEGFLDHLPNEVIEAP